MREREREWKLGVESASLKGGIRSSLDIGNKVRKYIFQVIFFVIFSCIIKGETETPYSITIRLIFKHLSLSLPLSLSLSLYEFHIIERDHLFDYNPSLLSGILGLKTFSKVRARPLIQLQSVNFFSISLSLTLSLYGIHIKGWTETPYSSTICRVIAIFGLAKYSKVRARPQILLQSVRFLNISLLSLSLSLSLTL